MKTNLIMIIFILLGLKIYAQDIEYKIANKSCECISKHKGVLTDEIIFDYHSETLAKEVLRTPKIKQKVYRRPEVLRSISLKSFEILLVICFENGEEKYKKLEDKYYGASKDTIANLFFDSSKGLMEEGQFLPAIEGLLQAIKLDSTFVPAYDNLGVCYRNLNDYDNAIKYYEKSLSIFPTGRVAMSNLGLVYTSMEDYKQADKYYSRLIFVHSNFASGYCEFGKSYISREKYKKALEMLCIAHNISIMQNSDKISEVDEILSLLYLEMKEKGKQKTVGKILKKYNIEMVWPE